MDLCVTRLANLYLSLLYMQYNPLCVSHMCVWTCTKTPTIDTVVLVSYIIILLNEIVFAGSKPCSIHDDMCHINLIPICLHCMPIPVFYQHVKYIVNCNTSSSYLLFLTNPFTFTAYICAFLAQPLANVFELLYLKSCC